MSILSSRVTSYSQRAADTEKLMPPPLSLYVHLPWCVKKCPYCDFNSHTAKGALPFDDYIDALIRDLEQDLPLVWGRTIHSVFFGGGTPSLFPSHAIARFLQAASSRLRFAPAIEITLETNPGTAEYGKFEDYIKAGINRLSFGIQSFNDQALQRLGRIHNSQQAQHAVKLAQDAGITNINLDLMYALPQQTIEQAQTDLQQAFALNPTHISYYQLSLEPNTLFFANPPKGWADDDLAWDMQQQGQTLLAQAGYQQYEVSAYAQTGKQCNHNLNYWHFGDYLGIGAGAHGKITSGAEQHILRRWKTRHPQQYIAHAGTPQSIGGDEIIPTEQLPFEYMLNTLRLNQGFTLNHFQKATGLNTPTIAKAIQQAQTRQWLIVDGQQITPTELGKRFTNDVISLFLP